jgi:NitT/TauT family transport system substrate-binding protein
MIDRRGMLIAGGAVLASTAILNKSFASVGTLRVAALRFGSLNWLLETIRSEGLAEKAGLTLEILTVATNQAGPVALLSGDADVIVSDWTWALRQRAFGEELKFAPYSSALGAVMVPQSRNRQELALAQGLFPKDDGQRRQRSSKARIWCRTFAYRGNSQRAY